MLKFTILENDKGIIATVNCYQKGEKEPEFGCSGYYKKNAVLAKMSAFFNLVMWVCNGLK